MSSAKINENLYGQHEERSYIELQKGGGYFSKFDWQPDPYSLFMEALTTDRLSDEEAVSKLHKKPFLSQPIQNMKHKHQYVFHSKDF